MDYQQSLEKAVLEYAASLKSHPMQREVARVRIPGYMDNHVWAMAATLGDQGLLVVSVPSDQNGVGIAQLSESGASRLKEIRAAEEREEEAKRQRAAELNGLAHQKKWWQLWKRNGVSS